MKIRMPSLIVICLASVLSASAADQQPASVEKPTVDVAHQKTSTQKDGLTEFNLDFPGGTPKELVEAIEKAMGKPLNVIIPADDADTEIPPLRMNHVNVNELFGALYTASTKTVYRPYGGPPYATGYVFETSGKPSDDSIWSFVKHEPPTSLKRTPQRACRFYRLTPYLESGLTVDDITTAIQTGWKMLGDTSPPEISFHKETNLLIAVGEPDKLETIDAVLKALEPKMSGMVDPNTGLPVSVAKPAVVDPKTGLPVSAEHKSKSK